MYATYPQQVHRQAVYSGFFSVWKSPLWCIGSTAVTRVTSQRMSQTRQRQNRSRQHTLRRTTKTVVRCQPFVLLTEDNLRIPLIWDQQTHQIVSYICIHFGERLFVETIIQKGFVDETHALSLPFDTTVILTTNLSLIPQSKYTQPVFKRLCLSMPVNIV